MPANARQSFFAHSETRGGRSSILLKQKTKISKEKSEKQQHVQWIRDKQGAYELDADKREQHGPQGEADFPPPFIQKDSPHSLKLVLSLAKAYVSGPARYADQVRMV